MRITWTLSALLLSITAAACGGTTPVSTTTPSESTEPTRPAAIELTALGAETTLYRSGVAPERYATTCTGLPTLAVQTGVVITTTAPESVAVIDGTIAVPADVETATITAADGATATVRCLPEGFPKIEQTGSFSEWSLLAALPLAPNASPWRMLLEPNGYPAWFQRIQPAEFSDLSIVDGALLAATPGDRPLAVYNNRPGTGFHRFTFDGTTIASWVPSTGPGLDHHAAVVLGNGNLLAIMYEEVVATGLGGIGTVGDTTQPPSTPCPARAPADTEQALRGRVVEVASDGTVRHTWRIEDHFEHPSTRPEWVNTATDKTLHCVLDADHLNAVQFRQDPDAAPGTGMVVVTGRDNDGAWGIEWPSGKVRWKFSGSTERESLRILDDPLGGVIHPHDAHLLTDDLLLIYDNRSPADTRPEGAASRAALYRIDTADRTATLLATATLPCTTGRCGAYAMGSARITSAGTALVVGAGLSKEITAAEFSFDGTSFGAEPTATLHVANMAAYRVVPVPRADVPATLR